MKQRCLSLNPSKMDVLGLGREGMGWGCHLLAHDRIPFILVLTTKSLGVILNISPIHRG